MKYMKFVGPDQIQKQRVNIDASTLVDVLTLCAYWVVAGVAALAEECYSYSFPFQIRLHEQRTEGDFSSILLHITR